MTGPDDRTGDELVSHELVSDDLVSDDLACVELVELVTDHLEGVLEPDVRRRLERHLEECEGCVEHVEQVRRTVALLRAVPQDERLSPQARERLIGAFRAWRTDVEPDLGPDA